MAKLTKHAEVLNQLHTMVKKQAAEAQKNISGAPGEDVKSQSISDENENVNKNSVGPENVAQGYHQKPSEDAAEPCSAKSAETIGEEILDIIRKQADAQEGIKGEPCCDVKSESISDDKENVDKNAVKPENNTPQEAEQKPSSDKSEPVATAKKAEEDTKSEVEELAAKVASYELGRQFCAALLKSASEYSAPSEAELMKEAGRRDFDLMISEAAESLQQTEGEVSEKQAEEAGAEYFDTVLKEAALEEAIKENKELKEKVAQLEAFQKEEQAKLAAAKQAEAQAEAQSKLASAVADIVLEKLKTEIASTQEAK